MNILYTAGFEINGEINYIRFRRDSCGDWFIRVLDKVGHRDEAAIPYASIFTNKETIIDLIEQARAAHKVYNIKLTNPFLLYGDPKIYEIDFTPINIDKLNDDQKNEYIQYKLMKD